MSKKKGYDPFSEDSTKTVGERKPQVSAVDPMEELMSVEEASQDAEWASQDEWSADGEAALDPAMDGADLESLIQVDDVRDRVPAAEPEVARVIPASDPEVSRGPRPEPVASPRKSKVAPGVVLGVGSGVGLILWFAVHPILGGATIGVGLLTALALHLSADR